MPRLIDADALKKEAERLIRCEVEDGRERFYRINAVEVAAINVAPTIDAVPVVRCMDCKHFTEGMAIGMCKRIEDKPIIPIPFNHYCSFGERRIKQDGGTK